MGDKAVIAHYAGSKNHIAENYLSMIPYENVYTYVEPFGGMAGVLLAKAPHPLEIYNDANNKLAILLKALSNPETGYELLKLMVTVEFSEEFFDYAKNASNILQYFDNGILTACLTWCSLLMSYNGQMLTFKGVSTGLEEEQFFKRLLKKHVLIDRLNGVQVFNQDGVKLIEYYKDDPNTFIFADPPYTEERIDDTIKRRSIYGVEMLGDDLQTNFLNTVKTAKAKVMICSYQNKLYDRILCEEQNWERLVVAETCKSMSIGKKGERKKRATEVVYVNYDVKKCR